MLIFDIANSRNVIFIQIYHKGPPHQRLRQNLTKLDISRHFSTFLDISRHFSTRRIRSDNVEVADGNHVYLIIFLSIFTFPI